MVRAARTVAYLPYRTRIAVVGIIPTSKTFHGRDARSGFLFWCWPLSASCP
jgi:hypothetical protein